MYLRRAHAQAPRTARMVMEPWSSERRGTSKRQAGGWACTAEAAVLVDSGVLGRVVCESGSDQSEEGL